MTNAALDTGLFSNPWSGLAGLNSAAISQVGDCLQACTEACFGWQQELAQFSQARLEENQRSLAALLRSRDLADMVKVQHDWGLCAATDYTREATRLTRLLTSLSLTGTTPDVQETANINA
jgi:hypothetical protein